jgi:XTP/dITP diphosphohydrolase
LALFGNAPQLLLATSNAGKLREYRALASGRAVEVALLPNFSALPCFEEAAPTFGENAAGKALHYSRFSELPVMADDSGLVVPALGGAPGVYSARYAGLEASNAQRIAKLLGEMREKQGIERNARFVCVLALAERGRLIAVFSDSAEGTILTEPQGSGGFGYDPVFLLPTAGGTFAELSEAEKNSLSHRGKVFAKLLAFLQSPQSLAL